MTKDVHFHIGVLVCSVTNLPNISPPPKFRVEYKRGDTHKGTTKVVQADPELNKATWFTGENCRSLRGAAGYPPITKEAPTPSTMEVAMEHGPMLLMKSLAGRQLGKSKKFHSPFDNSDNSFTFMATFQPKKKIIFKSKILELRLILDTQTDGKKGKKDKEGKSVNTVLEFSYDLVLSLQQQAASSSAPFTPSSDPASWSFASKSFSIPFNHDRITHGNSIVMNYNGIGESNDQDGSATLNVIVVGVNLDDPASDTLLDDRMLIYYSDILTSGDTHNKKSQAKDCEEDEMFPSEAHPTNNMEDIDNYPDLTGQGYSEELLPSYGTDTNLARVSSCGSKGQGNRVSYSTAMMQALGIGLAASIPNEQEQELKDGGDSDSIDISGERDDEQQYDAQNQRKSVRLDALVKLRQKRRAKGNTVESNEVIEVSDNALYQRRSVHFSIAHIEHGSEPRVTTQNNISTRSSIAVPVYVGNPLVPVERCDVVREGRKSYIQPELTVTEEIDPVTGEISHIEDVVINRSNTCKSIQVPVHVGNPLVPVERCDVVREELESNISQNTDIQSIKQSHSLELSPIKDEASSTSIGGTTKTDLPTAEEQRILPNKMLTAKYWIGQIATLLQQASRKDTISSYIDGDQYPPANVLLATAIERSIFLLDGCGDQDSYEDRDNEYMVSFLFFREIIVYILHDVLPPLESVVSQKQRSVHTSLSHSAKTNTSGVHPETSQHRAVGEWLVFLFVLRDVLEEREKRTGNGVHISSKNKKPSYPDAEEVSDTLNKLRRILNDANPSTLDIDPLTKNYKLWCINNTHLISSGYKSSQLLIPFIRQYILAVQFLITDAIISPITMIPSEQLEGWLGRDNGETKLDDEKNDSNYLLSKIVQTPVITLFLHSLDVLLSYLQRGASSKNVSGIDNCDKLHLCTIIKVTRDRIVANLFSGVFLFTGTVLLNSLTNAIAIAANFDKENLGLKNIEGVSDRNGTKKETPNSFEESCVAQLRAVTIVKGKESDVTEDYLNQKSYAVNIVSSDDSLADAEDSFFASKFNPFSIPSGTDADVSNNSGNRSDTGHDDETDESAAYTIEVVKCRVRSQHDGMVLKVLLSVYESWLQQKGLYASVVLGIKGNDVTCGSEILQTKGTLEQLSAKQFTKLRDICDIALVSKEQLLIESGICSNSHANGAEDDSSNSVFRGPNVDDLDPLLIYHLLSQFDPPSVHPFDSNGNGSISTDISDSSFAVSNSNNSNGIRPEVIEYFAKKAERCIIHAIAKEEPMRFYFDDGSSIPPQPHNINPSYWRLQHRDVAITQTVPREVLLYTDLVKVIMAGFLGRDIGLVLEDASCSDGRLMSPGDVLKCYGNDEGGHHNGKVYLGASGNSRHSVHYFARNSIPASRHSKRK